MDSYTERDEYGSGAMAGASFILGIASLVMIAAGLSLFVGALAVILALLSRGSGRMRSSALTGMITGIVGISLEVLIVAGSFLLIPREEMQELIRYFQEVYEEYSEEADSPMTSEIVVSPGNSGECPEWTYYLTEQELTV